MWWRLNSILFFVVLLIQIDAKPFLKNSLQAISSSISSASSPDSSSNIADLRRRRLDKLRQFAKYQTEDDDDLLLDDADKETPATDDQAGNEVLPNLLQKKVAKVMRKLQFLAQLINRFSAAGPGDEKVDKTEDTDFDFDFDSDEMDKEANSTAASLAGDLEDDETSDLIGEKDRDKEEFIEDLTPSKAGDKKPGNSAKSGLGVHFLEVLGSLFGIIYGAAMQITNGANSKLSL